MQGGVGPVGVVRVVAVAGVGDPQRQPFDAEHVQATRCGSESSRITGDS
jgi:hypothetical protein